MPEAISTSLQFFFFFHFSQDRMRREFRVISSSLHWMNFVKSCTINSHINLNLVWNLIDSSRRLFYRSLQSPRSGDTRKELFTWSLNAFRHMHSPSLQTHCLFLKIFFFWQPHGSLPQRACSCCLLLPSTFSSLFSFVSFDSSSLTFHRMDLSIGDIRSSLVAIISVRSCDVTRERKRKRWIEGAREGSIRIVTISH